MNKEPSLNEQIAIAYFGWRWLSCMGRPVRGTPGYGERQMMVRYFFPPDAELHKTWIDHFNQVEYLPATGDEPLDYAYCSSGGHHSPPNVSGDRNAAERLERLIFQQGLWDAYATKLAKITRRNREESIAFANCVQRCKAALAVKEQA